MLQFARALTLDEYGVTIAVCRVRVMLKITCGDVTMLSQTGSSLATLAKSAIDNGFNGIMCPGHIIACKNKMIRPLP